MNKAKATSSFSICLESLCFFFVLCLVFTTFIQFISSLFCLLASSLEKVKTKEGEREREREREKERKEKEKKIVK